MAKTSSERRKTQCPICRREVEQTASYPFCSERCKLIDLGNWLGGRYRISSPVKTEDDPAISEGISGKDFE